MLIKNVKIYAENTIIDNGYILIEGRKIKDMGPMRLCPQIDTTELDGQGFNLLPGFIDQHIHGARGADHMDGSIEAVSTIARALPKEGTTSYLATTMTQSLERVSNAVEKIVEYMENDNHEGEAEILGIHLEGPFISKKHIGAQNPKYVLKPNREAFDILWSASKGHVKLITYAPEEAEEGFTNYLREKGVVPSAGHTAASFDDIVAHIDEGLCNLTHFHNAMTPHHHRSPGAVTAGFVHDELKAEMIVDGVHLHPEVVNATYEIKGANNIILITDSMRAKGLGDGEYDLGGQNVIKKGMECRLATGSLAGSVAEMNLCVKNFKEYTGADILELVKVSSANSAQQLSVSDRKGSIAVGKDADLVLVNDDIDVQLTICRGKIAYQK